ncbi:hypothetical protein VPH35_041975 [Triticum aestivum]
MEDGDLLGGVEIEVSIPGSGAPTDRRFFWSHSSVRLSIYENAAFQAICFLQGVYGFVVMDYNYKSMSTYRELARSAMVLAASLVRTMHTDAHADVSAVVGDVDVAAQWQMLHTALVAMACAL